MVYMDPRELTAHGPRKISRQSKLWISPVLADLTALCPDRGRSLSNVHLRKWVIAQGRHWSGVLLARAAIGGSAMLVGWGLQAVAQGLQKGLATLSLPFASPGIGGAGRHGWTANL
jgi:hypothetical protein